MKVLGLVVAVYASSAATTAQARTCAVPASTLSLECDSACDSFEPCMLKSGSSASECDLECFKIDAENSSTYTKFKFLVPFGKWKSEQELATSSALLAASSPSNDTETVAFKSNDALTKINQWTLPSTTATVIIRGGSSLTGSLKSRVANVEFATDFLTMNTNVAELRLENFNLGSKIAKLAAKFPPGLQYLYLTNDLIASLPTEITAFKFLKYLILTDNYISRVDQSHEMRELTVLRLNNNGVSSFTALYQKLTYLDLAYNNLTEVPTIIPKYTQLKTLHLSGNKISEFKKEHAIETIIELGLFSNNLVSFDVYLPNLIYLNLFGNSFKEIPPAIFSHATLQELYLASNKLMKNVTLTNTQANFINTLKNFTADPDTFSANCDASQQTKVKGFTVCITGGAIDLGIIEGTRAPATASPKSSSGSKSSTDGSADTGKKESSSGSHTTVIILVAVAGMLAVVIVAGFVYWKKNKSDQSKLNTETNYTNNGTGTLTGGTNGTYTALWNDPDLLAVKVNSDDVQDIKKIGAGAFNDVWLVKYRNTQRLAAKRSRDGESSRKRTQEFIEEIKLVSTLKHPNIVEFIGAAWTKEADLQALFEYMENGDLRNYLTDAHTPKAWTLEKVQIAVDIAEALVYVHSFSPPLVHRDLKSRNVLLSENMTAKLTDFGVSRFRSQDNTMTAGVGTGKWLAPEVIAGNSDYGPPADVYSFGVVLSELDSHKLPYEDVRGPNGNKLVDVAMLQLVSSGELRPTFLPTCPRKIAEMAQLCLALRPADRPTAAEVAYALRTFKKSFRE